MTGPDAGVLIVGAGPAGMSAAVALADEGIASIVVDLAAGLGGAVDRKPLPGVPDAARPGAVGRSAAELEAAFLAAGAACTFWPQTGFAGLDHAGRVLLTGRHGRMIRPAGMILATGAREIVRPRPGWTLPGVRSVGSIQIALKTTGAAPAGRILLAGSGPLLLAAGAQLAAAGRPPVAIIEAGRPFTHPIEALRLPISYLTESACYLAALLRHRVPVIQNADLVSVAQAKEGGFEVRIEGGKGRHRTIRADVIGLHDGIESNIHGLPDTAPIPLLRAGDCREALGGQAAAIDGTLAGRRLARVLRGDTRTISDEGTGLARERRAQAAIARIFANRGEMQLAALPDDTVICRCEMRRLGDLRQLGTGPTDRELRLIGRFGMGACQGRYCSRWVRHLTGSVDPARMLGATRIPVRPVAIADFLDFGTGSDTHPDEQ